MRPGQSVAASEAARRGGIPMRRALAAALLVVLASTAAWASEPSVRHVYRTAPALIGLPTVAFDERYQNAADVVLEQAIRNLPLFPGAASAFTYRWNADHSKLEIVDDAVSPWFVTERAQTLGEGLLNVGLTFGYYRVNSWHGRDLGVDPVPLSVHGAPINYQAATDLIYSVSTFNITYGVTDDLDLNVAIPIVTLDMDLGVSGRLKECCVARSATRQPNAANLSDMLVRAKYRLFTSDWALGTAIGAAGLQVRIPTGNPAQGLGTGYGEIGPYFALSTSALDGWLDSYWDVGVNAGIGNTRWSSGDYRWALDIHEPRGEDWWNRLALAWEVLGRSEFTNLRQPSSISGPHETSAGTVQLPFLGIDASRHDYVDTTLGLRIRVMDQMVLSLGVFKALNDQGLRPSG